MLDLPLWAPILLIFPLIFVVKQGLIARVLRAIRWRPTRFDPRPWEELPRFLRERVSAVHPTLEGSGFVALGGVQESEGGGWTPRWSWAWLHPATGTVVRLRPRQGEWVFLGEDCWILSTRFAAGGGLITVTFPSSLLAPPPSVWQVEYLPGAGLDAAWARHVERVQERAAATGSQPLPLAPEAAAEEFAANERAVGEAFRADATCWEEDREGALRLRWSWIFRRGFKAIQPEMKELATRTAARRPPGTPPPAPFPYSEEAREELDLGAFHAMEAARRARRLTSRGRALVALVSLGVFAAFLWWRGEWQWAAMITGALLFHEAGHWAAMRWFGSRDTSMLFIPFFGGAAIQHDRPNVKPWQHVVILLAGPLPGLLIGFALGAWWFADMRAVPGWVSMLAGVLVTLNAFNLLVPVLPLDGGQLVNLALFGRTPRLAVAFKVASALALIAGSLVLGLGPLLWLVGLAFLMRVPTEWRAAAVQRELRREVAAGRLSETGDEDPWLRHILRRLRGPQFEGRRAVQRYIEATRLVPLVRQRAAGWGTALFALAGWLAPIWLPLAAILPMRWHGQWQLAQAEEQARAAGLPRPAEVRRARAERARALPPEQNAAVPLAQAERVWNEQNPPKPARRRPEAPAAPEAAPRSTAADERITVLVEEASRRPAFAIPPPAVDVRREIPRSTPLSWTPLTLLESHLADAFDAALRRGDFAAAARQFELAERFAAVVAGSAEEFPCRRGGQPLFRLLWALENGLLRLPPSPAAASGIDRLAAALPDAAWVRRTLAPAVPRERAWMEARRADHEQARFRPQAGAVDLPLLPLFLGLDEASSFSPRRHARFIAESLKIQAALADPNRPWEWASAGPPAAGGTSSAMLELSRLTTNEVAVLAVRLELERVALAWHRARLASDGRGPERIADLSAPFLAEIPRHPLTGEPARLERDRAGKLQLSFHADPTLTVALESSDENAEPDDDEQE